MLSRLSAARPEIADYPFTTKFPNLGLVQPTLDTSFVLADIPGLIEGASEGVGLGHEFLRHVERAGLLVHLVEPSPSDGSDPVKNYLAIRSELESYSPDLATRDEIVVVSKSELPGSEATRDLLQDAIGREVRLVSAVTGDGLMPLVHEIMARLVQWRKLQDVAPTSMPWENPADVAARAEAPVVPELEATKIRRVPPHLAGLTAGLSNDNQPRDFDGENALNAKPCGQQSKQFEVPARHAIVAVDLGNSAAKWAIDDQVEQRISLRFPDWSERLIEEAGKAVGSRTASWRVASVNRPITKQLVGRLTELSPDCDVKTISFDDIPMAVCVANPDRVGIDRLLAAWMCSKLYPKTLSIVVDAGSAITVDVVSREAEFLGGAILPGLALQFDSLARGTDALPAIDLVADMEQDITANQLPLPATDTISAIRSGILLGVSAAIDGLIQCCLDRLQNERNDSSPAQIVFTGGDATLLSKLTKHSHSLAPRLVLDAIEAIGRQQMLDRLTPKI